MSAVWQCSLHLPVAPLFCLLLRCLFCSALRSRLESRSTVSDSLGGNIIDCTGCDICCSFFLSLLPVFLYCVDLKQLVGQPEIRCDCSGEWILVVVRLECHLHKR